MKGVAAFDVRHVSDPQPMPHRDRCGFTLIEVVLVMVIIVIVAGISVPFFAGSLGATRLRTAARSIEQLARFSRSEAIMRQLTFVMVISEDPLQIYAGPVAQSEPEEADGVLDQESFVRLGYIKGETGGPVGISQKLISRKLPEGISMRHFTKDLTVSDAPIEGTYVVQYYPNGQCEGFELELENRKGSVIRLENDPISGKIMSEILQ